MREAQKSSLALADGLGAGKHLSHTLRLKTFRHFSSAVASETGRNTLANILAAYTTFKLDGMDLDWEYPGRQGVEGNTVDANDTFSRF